MKMTITKRAEMFLDLEKFPITIQVQSLSHYMCGLVSLFYTEDNWRRPGNLFLVTLSVTASNLDLTVKGLLN